jgi:hypothetical protein
MSGASNVRTTYVINHTPWVPERVACLGAMMDELERSAKGPIWCNSKDWRGTDWQQSKVQWALDQWRWAAAQDATHHVFMTDDLHLAPEFGHVLEAMIQGCPDHPIGLLSNHPRASQTYTLRHSWYRTNSWIVGPAYVLPHEFLIRFLAWFEALPEGPHTTPGTRAYRNDDSSINEYVTQSGSWSAHPLPTIIEHRGDIGSTVGHGDRYSRERISWRARRWFQAGEWHESAAFFDLDALATVEYWAGVERAPLLEVGAE